MASNGLELARYKGMLESLQQQDGEIDHIVVYSKFVVAYLLQQEGPNPGWRKANIEGPVYLVRRRSAPRYQLLVKNQFSTNDLLDNVHPDWELDCQKNYVFYKVEDSSKRIRGLWFHEDSERQKLEGMLEKMLEEIRRNSPKQNSHNNHHNIASLSAGEPPMQTPEAPQPQPQGQPGPPGLRAAGGAADHSQQQQAAGGQAAAQQMDSLYASFGLQNKTPPGPPEGGGGGGEGGGGGGAVNAASGAAAGQQQQQQQQVTVTRESLRAALHALVDDDDFLNAVMAKLRDHSR